MGEQESTELCLPEHVVGWQESKGMTARTSESVTDEQGSGENDHDNPYWLGKSKVRQMVNQQVNGGCSRDGPQCPVSVRRDSW